MSELELSLAIFQNIADHINEAIPDIITGVHPRGIDFWIHELTLGPDGAIYYSSPMIPRLGMILTEHICYLADPDYITKIIEYLKRSHCSR